MWNWGVPDCRNPKAYPADLRPHEWRWQFLRRRPDYRADWLLALQREKARVRFISGRRLRPIDWENNLYFWAELPGARARYGVYGLQNPAISRPGPGLFVQTYGALVDYASREEFKRMERQRQVLIRFDLNKPLRGQLEAAERMLRMELDDQPETKERLHTAKWPVYLRVIDARDCGETFRTIGEMIQGSGKEGGRQLWQQAQQVMVKPRP
jgi:hypothetical protein